MRLVVEPSDRCVLDGTVRPFDLAVRPRMLDLCEPVLDAVLAAAHVEHVGHVSGCWAIGVARRKRELDAVVGENGVDFVGDGFDQFVKESSGGDCGRLLHQPSESELRGRSTATNR